MSERAMSSWGEAYRAIPIVEQWGEAGWKAGVLLSAGDPRGERPAKSLGEQVFASREDAWQYANSEYGSLGG